MDVLIGWSTIVLSSSENSFPADVVVKCTSVQPWSALTPEPCGTCEVRSAGSSDNTGRQDTVQSAVPCKPPSRCDQDDNDGDGDDEDASCVLTPWGLLGKISSILWRCWLVLTLTVQWWSVRCDVIKIRCCVLITLNLRWFLFTRHMDVVIQTCHNCPDKSNACLGTLNNNVFLLDKFYWNFKTKELGL